MNYKLQSKVLLTGIVLETELNMNTTNIVRPSAQMTTYSPLAKEWIDNIYVVFSEHSHARQFRAISKNDILLIQGELTYIPDQGYLIYVDDYSHLKKTPTSAKLSDVKVLLTTQMAIHNHIFLHGNVTYSRPGFAHLSYNNQQTVRGNKHVEQTSIPLLFSNDTTMQSHESIFIGEFAKHYIQGELFNVSSV